MNSDGTLADARVADALNSFYHEHDLGEDGGANESWAKVRMGWISFYIPNPESRKRALFFHDVHHLATGYDTDLRGEAEIGAWEIASSCRKFWAAWLLNFFGFCMGLFLSPRRTFKAFIRGRNSLNFYHGLMQRKDIERSTIQEIRDVLQLNDAIVQPRSSDLIWFGIWCTPVAIAIVSMALAIVALV